MSTDLEKELVALYETKSKHSNYQILSNRLREIIQPNDIHTVTRYEKERLEYITSVIPIEGKSVIDIGANTGYFSFELLDRGATSVHYVEGNKEHAEFVTLAAKALGVEDRLRVTNDYFNFEGPYPEHYDVGLLFNVLHHTGDDYGDRGATIEQAKQHMLAQLNSFSSAVDTLVFQLGFNWMGNKEQPIFENGTKAEMIDFIREGVKDSWEIVHIAVAEGSKESPRFVGLNDENIKRRDDMGEFLNRPIFILKSRV